MIGDRHEPDADRAIERYFRGHGSDSMETVH